MPEAIVGSWTALEKSWMRVVSNVSRVKINPKKRNYFCQIYHHLNQLRTGIEYNLHLDVHRDLFQWGNLWWNDKLDRCMDHCANFNQLFLHHYFTPRLGYLWNQSLLQQASESCCWNHVITSLYCCCGKASVARQKSVCFILRPRLRIWWRSKNIGTASQHN